MPKTNNEIILVTPVWNDARRLAKFGPQLASELAAADLPVYWVVADDGSGSQEKQRVQELVKTFRKTYANVEAMLFEERSRKGGAIYSAWDAFQDASWVGFVDADGAIDARSTLRLIKHAISKGFNGGCVGVRHHAQDTPVDRPLGRAISFRVFSLLVHRLVGIRFEDTQCGVKIVPAKAYHAISDQLQERGFIFDVELLLALEKQGCQIDELRIPWREMDGGKVHPLKDAWPMVVALLRIRRRLKAGLYY